jgi:hypothetical protein
LATKIFIIAHTSERMGVSSEKGYYFGITMGKM